jgi:predicted DNA-binding transcriptional regulator AlpA
MSKVPHRIASAVTGLRSRPGPSAFSSDCKEAELPRHERRIVHGADDLPQNRDASMRNAIDSEDRLLTTDEVAEFLSVSKSFVVKARGSGTGPDFIEMGDRVVRYKLSKVKAWRDAREVRRNKGLRKRK